MTRGLRRALISAASLVFMMPAVANAQTAGINVNIPGATNGQGASTAVQLLLILTVLTLAPSILIMMTSFTRIIIVLGFVRNALGTPTMPPTQVLTGIAIFLSLFIMSPTLMQINDTALQPLMNSKISQSQALDRAQIPIRNFMFKQTGQQEISLFMELAHQPRPKTRADVPTTALIPAFILSELKIAFEIGFLIFIPFLIIDMVVSAVLMSMGMVMLPPVVISLPFKILLFVLVDGWTLVVESLVKGFTG